MQCPKCGSNNVNVQIINEQTLKNAHHGLFLVAVLQLVDLDLVDLQMGISDSSRSDRSIQ